jgi:hypothetical protein
MKSRALGWTLLLVGNLIGSVWWISIFASTIPYGATRLTPSSTPALVIMIVSTLVGVVLIAIGKRQETLDED